MDEGRRKPILTSPPPAVSSRGVQWTRLAQSNIDVEVVFLGDSAPPPSVSLIYGNDGTSRGESMEMGSISNDTEGGVVSLAEEEL